MRKLNQNEHAFTGLEAAIVLIAFVVVAAVFSYVVLGAGFFTTQKSQEVVHTGVQQASSSMEIIGNVYGYNGTAAGQLDKIEYVVFTVGNTAGGAPIDVTQMIMTYVGTAQTVKTYDSAKSDTGEPALQNVEAPTDNTWYIVGIYNDVGTANKLLEPGEQFVLAVDLDAPGANEKFSLNLQPSIGAVFPIKRTVPAAVDPVNILY